MNRSQTGTGFWIPVGARIATGNGEAPGQHGSRSRRGGGPRQHITGLQRATGLLLTLACVAVATWYVPRIVAADGQALTGTVTSNGVVYLNFATPGQLAKVLVHIGQRVTNGQVLATEAVPGAAAVAAADRAAIAADKARLAELVAAAAQSTPADISGARAQLARDQAQLALEATDVVASTRIVAPARGTVIAVNGLPGDTADSAGVRDYPALSPAAPVTQQPLFSLLPAGPQSSLRAAGSALALPVVALRTVSSWQVIVLVPESSALAVRPGQAVTISVPAAHLNAVRGRIGELLATPVATGQGIAYQAVVDVLSRRADPPLSGMTADVQLGP